MAIKSGTFSADGELGPFRHNGGQSGFLIGNEDSNNIGSGTLKFKVVNKGVANGRSVIKEVTSTATPADNRFVFDWPSRCDVMVELTGSSSPDLYVEQQD